MFPEFNDNNVLLILVLLAMNTRCWTHIYYHAILAIIDEGYLRQMNFLCSLARLETNLRALPLTGVLFQIPVEGERTQTVLLLW
jgi:hypothetical protein